MRFRKKPVIIDAFKSSDLILFATGDWKSLPICVADGYERGLFVFCPDCIYVNTLEGSMRAEKEDWIIRGVKGEFYPCKPDIFEQTYEIAEQ